MKNNFEIISRPHGDCWKHKEKDFWIVFYVALAEWGKPPYVAYVATTGCYQRDPWTVSNKAIGAYPTLKKAMQEAK